MRRRIEFANVSMRISGDELAHKMYRNNFRGYRAVHRGFICLHFRRSRNGEKLNRLVDLGGRNGTDHQLHRTTGVSVVDRDRN